MNNSGVYRQMVYRLFSFYRVVVPAYGAPRLAARSRLSPRCGLRQFTHGILHAPATTPEPYQHSPPQPGPRVSCIQKILHPSILSPLLDTCTGLDLVASLRTLHFWAEATRDRGGYDHRGGPLPRRPNARCFPVNHSI